LATGGKEKNRALKDFKIMLTLYSLGASSIYNNMTNQSVHCNMQTRNYVKKIHNSKTRALK